jgi:hypothetical protein
MKRHPFDLTSFIFGAVFGGAAVVYLLADQFAWDIDGRWILPLALITLGVAGIAGAVSGLRTDKDDASVDAELGDNDESEPVRPSVS